ncbi:MAG TPA: sugar phosphate isomerase/epimerase [Dehalococcoidia bacterium]|jgi:sugar phosphate isomerase/epimerase|nr:sugar phosphate isomerase/epimerase [Dehalococcoidia bacterium]HIK90021.1 sugar phosphate isomerase/epimerase [Dehalococcoidia bacterium]
MIEISVATSCLDNSESVRYAIERAIEHGFNGVEFNAPSVYLSKQTLVDLKWMFEMSQEHELRYTHHFPPSALPGSHVVATRERDLEDFSQEIFVAGELGVEVMVLHPGRLHVPGVEREEVSEEDRAISMSHFIDWVKDAAVEAENAGVVIGLENMHYNPGWVIRSHQELADAVDEIDSPAVGITFDVGHAWGSGGIEAGIETFGDRIKHVQTHDARGPEGAGNVRDQHMEIGTGLIDFSADGAIGKLVASGSSNGPFIVALETSGRNPEREGIALRSRDLLRGLWD